MGAIIILNCYAFLAVIPLVILTPLAFVALLIFESFSVFVLIMIRAAILPVYFLPLILGNPYVVRLVNLKTPDSRKDASVVQIAFDKL